MSETVEQYFAQHTGGAGFDITYDTVGGATLDASCRATRLYHCHVVSCLGWGTHALAPLSFRGASYSSVFTMLPLLSGQGRAHHGDILREATKLVEAGKIKVTLDANSYTLAAFSAAHMAMVEGSAKGKLVVDIEQVGVSLD